MCHGFCGYNAMLPLKFVKHTTKQSVHECDKGVKVEEAC